MSLVVASAWQRARCQLAPRLRGRGGKVKTVSREVLFGIRWGGRSGWFSITTHCSGVQ